MTKPQNILKTQTSVLSVSAVAWYYFIQSFILVFIAFWSDLLSMKPVEKLVQVTRTVGSLLSRRAASVVDQQMQKSSATAIRDRAWYLL